MAMALKAMEKPTRSRYMVKVARKQASTTCRRLGRLRRLLCRKSLG